jgi:hypothetical protein
VKKRAPAARFHHFTARLYPGRFRLANNNWQMFSMHHFFRLFFPAAAEGFDEADGGGVATAG